MFAHFCFIPFLLCVFEQAVKDGRHGITIVRIIFYFILLFKKFLLSALNQYLMLPFALLSVHTA
jgi:hypothetical protein